MKNLPIGIQTFEKLFENNCVYVDKTALIYNLVHDGTVYFLSRPRRFGKSLLISTLDAYFSGQKDLFQGLAIEKLEQEWKKYPVIRIDFSMNGYQKYENLLIALNSILREYELDYEIEKPSDSPADRFENLIKGISKKTGKKVVVLIDEYDKPILDALYSDIEQQNRDEIKNFYGVLKNCDQYLKFIFLTGITRVAHLNIFSGLNQLQDISMSNKYSSICGITENEMYSYFDDRIENMATENEMTKEECVEKLKKMYDGYHFSPSSPDIYNPFSLLNAFSENRFILRWFESGTPTMLIKVLEEQTCDISKFVNQFEVKESSFNNFKTDGNGFLSLVYQSGYLTIKDYNKKSDLYTLGMPNFEVTDGFYTCLLNKFSSIPADDLGLKAENFRVALEECNLAKLEQLLKTSIANLPYLNNQTLYEDMYRNVLHMIFTLTGYQVIGEYACNCGRADIVVQTPKYVYIFELKMQNGADLDAKAQEALSQIDEKNYADRFDSTGKEIIKIALVFGDNLKGLGKMAYNRQDC